MTWIEWTHLIVQLLILAWLIVLHRRGTRAYHRQLGIRGAISQHTKRLNKLDATRHDVPLQVQDHITSKVQEMRECVLELCQMELQRALTSLPETARRIQLLEEKAAQNNPGVAEGLARRIERIERGEFEKREHGKKVDIFTLMAAHQELAAAVAQLQLRLAKPVLPEPKPVDGTANQGIGLADEKFGPMPTALKPSWLTRLRSWAGFVKPD